MNAATALLSTTVTDAIVGGLRGASGVPGVVWPAVLRNAAIVAIIALSQGRMILSGGVLLGGLGLVRWARSGQDVAIRQSMIDAAVVALSSLLLANIVQASDNVKILIALAILYNDGRGMVASVVQNVGEEKLLLAAVLAAGLLTR